MADSVKVFGQEMDKKTLYIGGAAAVGILAYLWYRHSQSAAAGSSSGSAASSGSSTGTTDNIDPQTGYPYGSPEDQAALASTTGGLGGSSGLSSDVYGIDPNTGQYGYYDPTSGGWIDTGGGPSTSSGSSHKSQTNAQWEQQALADLENGFVGKNIISNAESGLPRYLAHLTLTQAQATAVQMAVGLAGSPPEGGPYAIRIAPDNHKPPVRKVKVPNVEGRLAAAAREAIQDAGLKAHFIPREVGIVAYQEPKPGTEVKDGSTVSLHMAATG